MGVGETKSYLDNITGQGWMCEDCNRYVNASEKHQCPAIYDPPFSSSRIRDMSYEQGERIIALLQAIYDRMQYEWTHS